MSLACACTPLRMGPAPTRLTPPCAEERELFRTAGIVVCARLWKLASPQGQHGEPLHTPFLSPPSSAIRA